MPHGASVVPSANQPVQKVRAEPVELAKLWTVLPTEPARQAVRSFFYKTLLTTGMRAGEALALTWGDVDFLGGEVNISKTYTEKQQIGVTEPKTQGSRRTVDMNPGARKALEGWYALASTSGFDVAAGGLVFPHPQGGHLSETNLLKRLYSAMTKAGIPREGEHGRKRTLHSLRHTFARASGEAGAPLEWIGAQLGHSSIKITRDTYGHWSRDAEKKMAASLEGAFNV